MRVVAVLALFYFIDFHPLYAQPGTPEGTKAGVVEKGLKKEERDLRPDKEVPPPEGVVTEEGEIKEGEKFLVRLFRFEGSRVIDERELEELVREYKGRELSLKGLGEVCALITRHYRDQGYVLARAYLPEQEIKEGVVLIRIREVFWGDIRVQGNQYYSTGFILKHFRGMEGRAVDYDELLKALLIVNGYSDLNVRAVFKEGRDPGTTDLVLEVKDARPFHVYGEYDNFGSRYVSRSRSGLRMEYGNLVFDGDSFGARGVTGFPPDSLTFSELHYTFPLNGRGTKVDLSYYRTDFEVGKEYDFLGIEGNSEIYEVELRQPLIRSRRTNLDMFAGYTFKSLENFMLSTETSSDDLRIVHAGLSGDRIDSLGGRSYVTLGISQGIPGLMGGLENEDPGASRAGSGGRFTIYHMDFARIQRLPLRSFLVLRASGQWASDTLPSSEQIYIGGADTVRGYSEATYLGDEGYVLGVELRFPPPLILDGKTPWMDRTWGEFVQFKGFWDHGAVSLKSPLEGEDEDRTLTGYGFGVHLSFPGNVEVDLDVGFPEDREKHVKESKFMIYGGITMKFF